MTETSLERDTWVEELGQSWPLLVAILTVGLATLGWVCGLADPDLPMHLATGEWIVSHGQLPYTEPFAWSRAGAPFFAYSWLPELAYLAARNAAGANGLHAIQALTAASSFLVVVALGRVARWGGWATLLLAVVSSAMWTSFIVAVRPQALMGITLPLAWMGAELIVRKRAWSGGLIVALAAAINVNSHLLFPITVVPAVRFLAEREFSGRQAASYLACNALGWIATPYGLAMVDVLRLNFGTNPLFDTLSPLVDFWPGFKAMRHAGVSVASLAFGLVLLAPFALPASRLTDHERWAYALAWLLGLGLFGTAVRGLVIWWALSLPLLARMVRLVPAPSSAMIRRVNLFLVACLPIGLARFEFRAAASGPQVSLTRESRQLPLASAPVLEPLVRWIECSSRAPQGTRAYNIFDHGSYLTYRLPTLSYSVDGRTIFPDSVADAEAYQVSVKGPMKLGPWRSAEVAFAPRRHAIAQILDEDPEWQLVRVSIPVADSTAAVGLWAKRSWLTRFALRRETRADTVRATQSVPERIDCDTSGRSRAESSMRAGGPR